MNRQEIIEDIISKLFVRDEDKTMRSTLMMRSVLKRVNDMDLLSIAHEFGVEEKEAA